MTEYVQKEDLADFASEEGGEHLRLYSNRRLSWVKARREDVIDIGDVTFLVNKAEPGLQNCQKTAERLRSVIMGNRTSQSARATTARMTGARLLDK